MPSIQRNTFRNIDQEVYGEPPDQSISHAAKIYGLSVILAAIALTQWIIIGYTHMLSHSRSEERYGWWLLCTFFAVATLSWTKLGRKVPFNYIIIAAIVESSTIYIAMEQKHNENRLVNFYAGIVVVALMLASIFWGAYFPMFIVPGDLLLSCLVAIANIMMIIFFINVLFINYQGIYYAVRNTFALVAICMVMYTATIIHDRQFDVPKNEYLFLSVLQFFSYMILHERILAISFTSALKTSC
ncbi:uncharacterized protein LOC6731573 [Drosophila simulans]|uniref:GD23571 n=2 Tax=melanogaster subgroup TaxID=32351 RepID=B4Q7A5_DROSI|nr:uncharacterized protein LOC6731573 [Drosophila simulans]XP_033161386.1 uncharacterized protein LOC117141835 [Drosophila mauritiana]EDX04299.1 GD23571 [Drosophila simulans]KMY89159.1 uncharacterized protein Dsimw501_GD23571 [Drosophila simulans]